MEKIKAKRKALDFKLFQQTRKHPERRQAMSNTYGITERTCLWKINSHMKIAGTSCQLVLSLMIFSLSGCAVMHKVMINEEGKQAVLSSGGWGFLGAPTAVVVHLAEEKKYRDQGYMEIEEFEKKEGPKVEERAGIKAPSGEAPPVWKVGDSWTYQVTGISKGQHRQEIVGEENVDGLNAYVMQSDNKTLYFDRSLNPIQVCKEGVIECTYSPPRQDYDWPLTVGKTWKAEGKAKTASSESSFARQVTVKGYGIVRVPAGEFEAFYILTTSAAFTGPNWDQEPRLLEAWYAPKIRHHLKRIVYTDKGWIILELTSFNAGPPGGTKPSGTTDQEKGKPE